MCCHAVPVSIADMEETAAPEALGSALWHSLARDGVNVASLSIQAF